MGKKLLKKQKKKYARDEESDEDDIEENVEDGYEEDGFVVPDADVELDEGGYQPMNLDVDPEAPDAEIESELASSDYDIMDEKMASKKLKKLHKGRREVEEEEIPKTQKVERKKKFYVDYEREEIDNFIERDEEYVKAQGEIFEGRRVSKSLAHNIFSLERDEEENEGEQFDVQKKNIEHHLTSIYGKEELEEEYETEKDKVIKTLDYPERLLRQFTEEQLMAMNRDVDLESEWIIEKMKTFSSNVDNIGNIKKKITLVLEYHKKDFFDVPFIALYRKMYYEPELSMKDIWKIFELDKEWMKLMDYKQNVKKQWSTVVKFLEPKKVEFMERRYLDNAKTITDLKDMEAFIAFTREFYREEIENQLDNQIQRPNKISVLEKIRESKIHEFARKFALSSHEMAINLEMITSGDSRNRLFPPPDPNTDPAYLSYKYINSIYDQEIKVMTIACKYLAIEMVSYPYIRNYARNYFKKNCTVSTEPTEEGKNELNVFHPSFRVKRLKKKPVESFTNDLFLDILQCEMKNLITVKIECEEDLKDISERLNTAYNFDNRTNFSSSNINADTSQDSLSSKWKIMREEAIRMLVIDYLFPEFIREIRAELIEKAENYVTQECANSFNNLLLTGPYKKQKQSQNEDDLFRDDESPKVMSFIYDSSKNEVYCTVIDQNGELLDYNIFNNLANKPSKNLKHEEKELYYDDIKNIKEIIEKYAPDLIVIGANDLKCKYIKEQIISVDPEHIVKNQGEKGAMWITFGDLTVPRIYSNSTLSEKRYKTYNMFIRQAISLGRFKQNPLSEILQLWHEDVNKNNCLSIPLHPLQKMINKNKLAEALEMEAIKVSNAVGIEINKAYENSHLRGPLQFISGLGPRKAAYIMDRLIILKGLQMRMQLLTNSILSKRVFMNCSAFFKIKTSPDWQDSKKYNLLDMTRIHPESYPLSNKLASSAVEDDIKQNEDCILTLLKDPKKFNMLELKDFIRKSEEKGTVSFRTVINFIILEFNNPFKDPRPQHKDLTPSEIFYLLVGDENIRVGHIVLAKVVRVDSQHVKCRLLNDLEATVWIKDIFEDEHLDPYKEQEMKEKYKEGMLFEARIKSINENSFKIDLETKPSVMSSHKNSMQVHFDNKYFHLIEEDYINKNYKEEIKADNRKYISRGIKHPAFKNITFFAALEYLRSRDIGDYLFRPSSKGINNITLTWNFYRHVYSHIDIQEEDKIPGATIGSKLRIANDVYFSLDEIIDRYLKPCEKLVKEVSSYRKFYHTDSMEEFEKRLKDDKSKDPALIQYLFTILPEYPQYIIMGYCPKINFVTKEYIKVKPRGLFFHGDYFSSIEDLVVWFKKNYGEDSYREYLRRIKPPVIEERRKKDDPSEFQSMEFPSAALSDTFDNNLSKNATRSQFLFDTSKRSSFNDRENTNNYFRYPNNNQRSERFVGNKRERSPQNDNNINKDRKVDSNPSWGGDSNDNNASIGWGNTETVQNDFGSWGQTSKDNFNNNPSEITSNDFKTTDSGWGNNNPKDFGKSSQTWGESDNTKNEYKSYENSKPRFEQKQGYGENRRNFERDGNFRKKACFICKDEGHMVNECPKKSQDGNKRKNTCFNCNEEGHMSRDCPKPRERGSRGGRGRGGGIRSPDREEFKSPHNDWKTEKNDNEGTNQGWGSGPNAENSGWGYFNNNENTSNEAAGSKFKNESTAWGITTSNEQNNNNNLNSNTSSGWGDSAGWTSHEPAVTEPINKLPQESAPTWGNSTSNELNSNFGQSTNNNFTSNWGNTTSNNDNINQSNTWGNPSESENVAAKNNTSSGWGANENTNNNWNTANQNSSANEWGKSDNNNARSSWNNFEDQSSNNNFNSNFMNKNDNYSKNRDNRGNFRNGGNNSDRKRGCFSCGEEGHFSKDCPNKGKRDNSKKRGCYSCGEEGHISNNCPNKKDDGGRGQKNFRGRGGGFKSPNRDYNRENSSKQTYHSYSNSKQWGKDSSNNNEPQNDWGSSSSNINQSGWGSSSNNDAGAGWGASTNSEPQSSWGASTNTVNQGGWNTTESSNTDNQGGWASESNTQNQNASVPNDAWKASSNTDNQGGWGSSTQNASESQGGWGTSSNRDNQGGWGS